jgi:hypothetical protein
VTGEDVRAVLEAVAYGDDPRVTPSDRLRALEHLSRMDDAESPSAGYSSELTALAGEELDRHLDALLADQIAADVFGETKRWPVLAQFIDREVERRARTLAQELHVAQVEAEIDRRVEERVCQLATEQANEEAADYPPLPQEPGPPGVTAGFPSRHPRQRSESVFRQRPRAA